MKIAYCITGFVRVIHSKQTIKALLQKSLPPNSEIDLFWYCPRQNDPDDISTFVNEEKLIDSFKDVGIQTVTINWFDYDPKIFRLDFDRFSFNPEELAGNRSVFRTMSQIYNISKTIQLVHDSGKFYDVVCVTRNDYMTYISTFGIPDTIKQGVYVFRTCPYRTTVQQVGFGGNHLDSEDRAFYGTHAEMMEIRNYYQKLPLVYTSPKLYPEIIHTLFFRSYLSDECIYYQEGMNIAMMPIGVRTPTTLHFNNKEESEFINATFGIVKINTGINSNDTGATPRLRPPALAASGNRLSSQRSIWPLGIRIGHPYTVNRKG